LAIVEELEASSSVFPASAMAWFQSLFSTTKRSTALSAVDESGGESTSTGLVRTVSVQSQVTAVPAMEVLRETFRGGDTARRQDELIARLRKKKQDAEDECKPLETLPKQDLERYMVLSSRYVPTATRPTLDVR
jgi:hypothetical protein